MHVLVVDDDPLMQKMLQVFLVRQQMTVEIAENGRSAVEAAASGRFDAILMDLQMPVMDGLEATERIRQRERETGEHVLIIAVTAWDSAEDRRRCLLAGMDGYVTKPVDFPQLLKALSG